jgi:DNA-binding transcriptional LysR family regulator
MNLRLLEAFRAVIQGKTVTRAAEMLFVSQPAVTRLIADLERNVGFALFERRKGRLHPTPEALALYEEVERSFTGVTKIARTAREIRDFRTGSLVIAGLPALSLGYLPKVIAGFVDTHPGVTVSLQIRSSQKVAEWIAAQQCDLGLAEIHVEDPAVEEELLLRTDMVCVLPPGHPLQNRTEIRPQDLEGEVFIGAGAAEGMILKLENVFAEAKVKVRQQIETQLSAAACAFVLAGAGVTVVEPVTAFSYRDRGLVIKPFAAQVPFDFTLLYPAHRPRSRLAKEFAATLRETLTRDLAGLFD